MAKVVLEHSQHCRDATAATDQLHRADGVEGDARQLHRLVRGGCCGLHESACHVRVYVRENETFLTRRSIAGIHSANHVNECQLELMRYQHKTPTRDSGVLARSMMDAASSSNLSRVMDEEKSMSSIRHSTLMGASLLALSTFFSCGRRPVKHHKRCRPCHTLPTQYPLSFYLFTGQSHAEAGLGVGRDVLFVLFLHLGSKVRKEHLVKVAAAKVAVPGVGKNLQLPLFQCHDAHLLRRDVSRYTCNTRNNHHNTMDGNPTWYELCEKSINATWMGLVSGRSVL